MPDWLTVLLGTTGGIVVLWAGLIVVLWVQQRRTSSTVDWRAMMRLVPDVIRLVKRLATDPSVPRGTRWWLLALMGYLLLPFDLVPDFIPVLGYADDAIVVAIVLRFAIRRAGMAAIRRHWPGTREGLASLLTLTGLATESAPEA
ncbi:YkvA family protein [Microbacterium lacus]|uniref:YkvA family protein n=1 Tax=Microbacterium lacus TaxID=415217 RepID=A0ABP4RV09_9MICO